MGSTNRKIDKVIQLNVPDDILVERITGRLLHKPSGRTYHSIFNPPKVEMKDDVTGDDLIRRKDDTKEVLIPRLEAYHNQTKPLIDFYKQRGIVKIIDANDKLSTVWQRIKSAVGINMDRWSKKKD